MQAPIGVERSACSSSATTSICRVQPMRPERDLISLGRSLLTGESEQLDRMTFLLKALAKALALSGFAGAVEAFDNN